MATLAEIQAELQSRSAGANPSDKGFWQKAKEQLLGDDDPTTQNTGEKIGTFLNKAGEAMTFGLIGDEADAAVAAAIPGGMGYQERLGHNREQEAILERDNPGAALTAEIGGSLMGALLPMGQAATLARGAGLMPRIAASTAAGAAGGATYGFMEGEGAEDRRSDALLGGGVGGAVGFLAPAIGAGVQRAGDRIVQNRMLKMLSKNAPSTDELRRAGQAAYKQIDDAGVQIKPESFSGARQKILEMLRSQGLDELPGAGSLTPKSARVMQIADGMDTAMKAEPTAALPFSSVDQLRRHAGTAASAVDNKTDARLGAMTIESLDDFINRLGPEDVVTGDAAVLKDMLPKARDIWARMSRSQLVDDAIDAGEDYLSGASSGIRNQFRRILRSDKLSRGFSDAEKAVMRRVVNGSVPEQLLNMAGSGIGQIAQMGAGLGLGGLPGAMIGAGTAAAARKGSEAITRKNAEVVRALIANGGMPQLPVASEGPRKIIEALMRQTGGVVPQ